mmetsp:Transcript_40729/g.117955  ORF Transcript_40729/g.117955 Transcript_40729/m.117955 type:complete len:198 (-) Transcript_40729:139-732(-)
MATMRVDLSLEGRAWHLEEDLPLVLYGIVGQDTWRTLATDMNAAFHKSQTNISKGTTKAILLVAPFEVIALAIFGYLLRDNEILMLPAGICLVALGLVAALGVGLSLARSARRACKKEYEAICQRANASTNGMTFRRVEVNDELFPKAFIEVMCTPAVMSAADAKMDAPPEVGAEVGSKDQVGDIAVVDVPGTLPGA